jgi:hypothetical protein
VTARSQLGVLIAGLVAVLAASLAGALGDLVTSIAAPPPIVRAALVGTSVVIGFWLLALALRRIEASRNTGINDEVVASDFGGLVRGVRYVFLAAAVFSAGAGWLFGQPLPIVIALVIAGIDLAETSFLLLIAAGRGG